jgi:2-C-methyl-D-erythritol 4-phosphate cytidylyltransferase
MTTSYPPIIGLIPAAGAGQRLGGQLPKQYQPLAGLPMLVHTIRALQNHPAVQHLYVVLAPNDTLFVELCAPHVSECTPLYCGGESRAASVTGGVRALAQHYHRTPENPWLMVHDAARPCLHAEDLATLIAHIQSSESSPAPHAYILANPVADTLKRASAPSPTSSPHIHETVPRENLWQAQTPQVATLNDLLSALNAEYPTNIHSPTDEAQALERQGHIIELVQARHPNFKVTYPADQKLAARLLDQGTIPYAT